MMQLELIERDRYLTLVIHSSTKQMFTMGQQWSRANVVRVELEKVLNEFVGIQWDRQ